LGVLKWKTLLQVYPALVEGKPFLESLPAIQIHYPLPPPLQDDASSLGKPEAARKERDFSI
jgi:hypothetical protein